MAERATTEDEWKKVETKQRRRTRRCSYCGSELHTLKDCPELLKRQDGGE